MNRFFGGLISYSNRLKPIESLVKGYNSIDFREINPQEHPDIVSKYGIQAIPIIKFFHKIVILMK